MRIVEREEFEPGDKVKLGDWVNLNFFRQYYPQMINTVMTVQFQNGNEVWTDKGIVDFDCLELVEE